MMPNRDMNILHFKVWIEAKGATCRLGKAKMNCILNVDHIEPGLWAALYAQQTPDGLLVVELSDHFSSATAAWQALDDPASPSQPPRPFPDWVGEQSLTHRSAQLENLDL